MLWQFRNFTPKIHSHISVSLSHNTVESYTCSSLSVKLLTKEIILKSFSELLHIK
nr:MAG TPA: hypothetical protein [Caudoviricetes sp.]